MAFRPFSWSPPACAATPCARASSEAMPFRRVTMRSPPRPDSSPSAAAAPRTFADGDAAATPASPPPRRPRRCRAPRPGRGAPPRAAHAARRSRPRGRPSCRGRPGRAPARRPPGSPRRCPGGKTVSEWPMRKVKGPAARDGEGEVVAEGAARDPLHRDAARRGARSATIEATAFTPATFRVKEFWSTRRRSSASIDGALRGEPGHGLLERAIHFVDLHRPACQRGRAGIWFHHGRTQALPGRGDRWLGLRRRRDDPPPPPPPRRRALPGGLGRLRRRAARGGPPVARGAHRPRLRGPRAGGRRRRDGRRPPRPAPQGRPPRRCRRSPRCPR